MPTMVNLEHVRRVLLTNSLEFAFNVVAIKYVWKIVGRRSTEAPDHRPSYTWAGSMGEALEMAGDP